MGCLVSLCTSRDVFQDLKIAIINNDLDMLKGFYQFSIEEMQDVDVNANILTDTNDFNTLLNVAVKHKNSDAVEFLLNMGADPNLKHDVEYSLTYPLLQAISNRDLAIASLLINKGANINKYRPLDVPLLQAVKLKDYAIVKLLIDNGVDLNAESYTNTALTNAIKGNDIDLVKLLVDNGANTNTPLLKQPLLVAININNIEISEYLLRNNADFNALKQDDFNIKEDHLPLLQWLAANGIDLAQKPYILKCAIQQASLPLVNFLFSKGLTLNKLEISPYVYLNHCDNENYTKMVNFLKSKSELPNQYIGDDDTILSRVMQYYDIAVVNHRLITLIEAGADPNIKAINGRFPLELAVMRQYTSTIKLLLTLCADPNLLDINFVAKQNVQITQLLIEGGYENIQQLRENIFLKSLAEIVRKEILDSTFSLFDQQENKASIELRNDPAQINEIVSLVANKNFYFFVRVDENRYKIDSMAALKSLYYNSIKLGNHNNDLFSTVNIQKIHLTEIDANIERFASYDLVSSRAMQMLTDEIIGLHQLVESKIFTKNQALNIGKYLSYDKHLEASCAGFYMENIIDYFFNVLSNPSIDPGNRYFKQGVNYIFSKKGQQFINTALPATAIKQIASSKQDYNQQSSEDIVDLHTQSQYLPMQRLLDGKSSNAHDIINSINTHGLNNIAVEWLNYMSMQLFSRSKIAELQQLLASNEINIPWFRAVFDSKSARAVKFKLHPDKNGNAEDFKIFTKISLELKNSVMNQQENWMKLVVNTNAKAIDLAKIIQAGVVGYKYAEQPGVDLGFKLLSYILPLVTSMSSTPQLANHANKFILVQQAYSMGIETAILSAFISFGMGELSKVNSGYSMAISSFVALTSLYNAANSVSDLLAADFQESLSTKANDIIAYITSNNVIPGDVSFDLPDSIT